MYIGNILGHPYANTYCPDCGHLLIERYGFEVIKVNLKDGRCPNCNGEIPIVGAATVSYFPSFG